MKTPLILVADDSTTIRASLRLQLERRGYDYVEAANGIAAIQVAKEHQPDAILLDIEMPGMNGHEVLGVLQEESSLRHIPVVMLSSRTNVTDVVDALDRGAHDYLTKPFDNAELLARVHAAVRTKRVEDELRALNAQLEAFGGRASHDLKSPLAIISGMADTLSRAEFRLTDEQRRDLLARISAAAKRAAKMIDDLLSLARQAGASTGTALDAERIVRECVDDADLDATEVTIGGAWVPVALAEADLTSVMANLIGNAGHYGRGADGYLHLRIVGQPTPTTLEIVVEDEGAGIADDDVDKVFDAFYRSPQSLEVNPSSTGVGLSIVRRAVERVGGRVQVARRQPTGSRFSVILPRAEGGGGS